MDTTRITFRTGEIASELDARAGDGVSADLIARRDLGRYYTLIADELAQLRLTEAEASAIVDVCNGWLVGDYQDPAYRLLWAEVAEAERYEQLGAKWGIDTAVLVTRLRDLSPGGAMAIIDAAERFWRTSIGERGEILRRVGLVRDA